MISKQKRQKENTFKRLKIRNRYKKVTLFLSLIRIVALAFSIHAMSGGRIPCDLTQRECNAYGTVGKDGTEIKWDKADSNIALRSQVFEMTDEQFNLFWSEDNQYRFKMAHYI